MLCLIHLCMHYIFELSTNVLSAIQTVSNPPSGFFSFYLYGLSYVAHSRFPREKPSPVLGLREGR